MTERPTEDDGTARSEQQDDASVTADTKGPLVMIVAFVALLGAIIVLGVLTNP